MSTIRLTISQIKRIHELRAKKKSIAFIARDLGVTRPTIYKVLRLYPKVPTKPKKVIPKTVVEFNESTVVQDFKRKYKHLELAKFINKARQGWQILGKKHPEAWDKNDFLKLWQHPDFFDPTTKKISFHNALIFRKWMVHIGRIDLTKDPDFSTRGLKRPKGARKLWFLEKEEIIRMIQHTQRPDVLLFARIALECGARPSCLISAKTDHIEYDKGLIFMYERKVKKWIERYFVKETMDLVLNYVKDQDIAFGKRLFPNSVPYYTLKLKDIGKRAGIDKLIKKGAGAYILRHTFATQAGEHDVSLEVVMKQGGWSDASTLLDFYLYIKASKMQRELLGLTVEKPKNFGDWVRQLIPHWEKQYEEVSTYVSIPKVKKKPKKKVPTRARVFSWDRIKAIIGSKPKTEKGKRLVNYWKKVWKEHEKHPRWSYEQIKEKL